MRPLSNHLVALVSALAFTMAGMAQLSVDVAGTSYTIDFDNTVTGVNDSTFAGTGFTPNPSAGQLDSDAWSVVGPNEGSLAFGGSETSGDFARGASGGGVGTGGIYSFNVGGGDRALGFQASGLDFTPGSITLRIQNNTGQIINSVSIGCDVYVLNDQDRSNYVRVAYSYDNTVLYLEPGMEVTSPEAADPTPSWSATNLSSTINNLFVPDGEYFYIRWETDDVSGSGSRDEFAIDNISITFNGNLIAPYISEIHWNPQYDETGTAYGTNERDAEWFEIYNPNSESVNFRDILIEDNNGNSQNILGSVIVPAQSYFVFGASCDQTENGDYSACGYEYGGGVPWNNTGDIVKLRYPGGGLIDEVDYTGWSFLTPGSSLTFTGTEADDNNDETYWISSVARENSFSSGAPNSDFGSPGTAGDPQLLAIKNMSIEALTVADGVQISWQPDDPQAENEMHLYHSTDGKGGQLLRPGLPTSGQHLHRNPSLGANYYWLEWEEGGVTHRSTIVKAFWDGDDGLSLYPNPVSDRLFITSGSLQGDLQVLNAYGQMVYQMRLDQTGTAIQLPVADLAPGWYFVRIMHAGEQVVSQSFFKQ